MATYKIKTKLDDDFLEKLKNNGCKIKENDVNVIEISHDNSFNQYIDYLTETKNKRINVLLRLDFSKTSFDNVDIRTELKLHHILNKYTNTDKFPLGGIYVFDDDTYKLKNLIFELKNVKNINNKKLVYNLSITYIKNVVVLAVET